MDAEGYQLLSSSRFTHGWMDRFIRKEYVPELLFDDKDILERINKHPMALWKCQY